MRTLMAVLADRAEEVDGKGSVIGIFQAVSAKRFPTTLNGVLECVRAIRGGSGESESRPQRIHLPQIRLSP